MAAPSPTSRSQRAKSSRLFRCRCNDCRSRVTWSRRREYRVEKPVAKLGGRHRSSVVELSIRNPARPAHASAGRRVFNDLGEECDGQRRLATPPLAPPLAPRLDFSAWQHPPSPHGASTITAESDPPGSSVWP